MEQKSKFLQRWERRLQQPAHKCSECGSHRHSWQVCPAYFSDWESVQGEHDCSIEELLQILALALIWWQKYLHGIYTHFVVCNICYTSGHSCSKKRDCPIRADKVLMKVFNKVTKVQVEDHSSDDDLRVLFEQEARKAIQEASRSVTAPVVVQTLESYKGGGNPVTKGMMVTLEGSKKSLRLGDKRLQHGSELKVSVLEGHVDHYGHIEEDQPPYKEQSQYDEDWCAPLQCSNEYVHIEAMVGRMEEHFTTVGNGVYDLANKAIYQPACTKDIISIVHNVDGEAMHPVKEVEIEVINAWSSTENSMPNQSVMKFGDKHQSMRPEFAQKVVFSASECSSLYRQEQEEILVELTNDIPVVKGNATWLLNTPWEYATVMWSGGLWLIYSLLAQCCKIIQWLWPVCYCVLQGLGSQALNRLVIIKGRLRSQAKILIHKQPCVKTLSNLQLEAQQTIGILAQFWKQQLCVPALQTVMGMKNQVHCTAWLDLAKCSRWYKKVMLHHSVLVNVAIQIVQQNCIYLLLDWQENFIEAWLLLMPVKGARQLPSLLEFISAACQRRFTWSSPPSCVLIVYVEDEPTFYMSRSEAIWNRHVIKDMDAGIINGNQHDLLMVVRLQIKDLEQGFATTMDKLLGIQVALHGFHIQWSAAQFSVMAMPNVLKQLEWSVQANSTFSTWIIWDPGGH